MTARILKQVIAELTREGCRVERLRHDPPVVTFRAPGGSRLILAADDYAFRLARFGDGDAPVRFATLRDAIKAACAA